jgi:hypothetical protein
MAKFFYANLVSSQEVTNNFKPAYDGIQWLNNEDDWFQTGRTRQQVTCTIECGGGKFSL